MLPQHVIHSFLLKDMFTSVHEKFVSCQTSLSYTSKIVFFDLSILGSIRVMLEASTNFIWP